MELNIIKAKEINPSSKGYLVGINNRYILNGGMFSFKTKKLGEKFIKRIIELTKEGKIKTLNDIKKEYALCFDVIEEKNSILDLLRLEYFDLFKQGLVKPISNDNQLIEFAKSNKNNLRNKIKNLDYFLEYCI